MYLTSGFVLNVKCVQVDSASLLLWVPNWFCKSVMANCFDIGKVMLNLRLCMLAISYIAQLWWFSHEWIALHCWHHIRYQSSIPGDLFSRLVMSIFSLRVEMKHWLELLANSSCDWFCVNNFGTSCFALCDSTKTTCFASLASALYVC
jgi:hypothetical protein